MMRLLWLTFETPPHPDAVCAPVEERDARLVLALLSAPHALRVWYATQFGNYLRQLEEGQRLSPFSAEAVLCRSPQGGFRRVPWRLAKWLAQVLPAEQGVLERTAARIARWLSSRRKDAVVSPYQGR